MKPLRSKAHLAFIREQACCIARMHVCGGVIEPMHYRGSKEGGVGMKPGDDKTCPGCSLAHKEQHRIGEKAFQAKYGISMADIAQLYWLISPAQFAEPDKPTKRKYLWGKRAKAKAKGPKKRLTHPTLKKKPNGEVVERKSKRAA